MSSNQISPTALVSRIWAIYRDQFLLLFGIAIALFAVPLVAVLLLPSADALPLAALLWAVSVLYQGMVVKLVQDVRNGRRDHSIRQLVHGVEPVFWRLLAVSLLAGLGIFIGFVLLIVPGLILEVIWSVVAPVTVLERPGVLAAFGRSRELVRGNGWQVFGVLVLVFLAVAAVNIAAGLVSSPLGSLGSTLVQWAVVAAAAPLAGLSASVIYFELIGA